MGKHKEWRRIAKKERRRRIRTTRAKTTDDVSLTFTTEEFEKWREEQKALEMFEIHQIEESNRRENDKWLSAERIAQENWTKLQEKMAYLQKTQLELQEKLNLELEIEKQKREKERQRIKEIEEENKRKQEQFIQKLETFLNDDGDPPTELLVYHESKPNSEPCPFFLKTACCRFGDECSRNHKYPGISKILLATNMFSHFGLENTNINEYDTDITLEFEESDTYRDFKEFFFDILPEFKKFGTVVELKVCNNYEKHLRGNTYVEYADLRSSVAAYRSLHGRWYGGKQLTFQFCDIKSWRNAICGLQSRKRCPKGNSCNFLHVFRNPGKYFQDEYHETRTVTSSARSWRWSKTPERQPTPHDRNLKKKYSHHGERNPRRSIRNGNNKAKLISYLNFESEEDALPFYDLSIRTLLHIYKTTLKDNECGYCKNRLYYLSDRLECPPSVLCKLLAKRTFLYSLTFEWLENSINILKEFNVQNERILRDLWVLKYHPKTIEDRFLRLKNAGIDTYYPWMVRCSEDILKRYIAVSQETKHILGETKSTKYYLAKRLNTSPEFIDEIFFKVPTLKCIRVTKVKKFMDFLIQEGFAVEDIANKPRILAASKDTVAKRLEKLQSLGLNKINLNVLCRSKKDFNKYCESMMYARAGAIKNVEKQ